MIVMASCLLPPFLLLVSLTILSANKLCPCYSVQPTIFYKSTPCPKALSMLQVCTSQYFYNSTLCKQALPMPYKCAPHNVIIMLLIALCQQALPMPYKCAPHNVIIILLIALCQQALPMPYKCAPHNAIIILLIALCQQALPMAEVCSPQPMPFLQYVRQEAETSLNNNFLYIFCFLV